ncbi:MAG: diguanylate cyclase, partial [Candidatus Eremiobacteraeota bacterium]|nr:diguanylate cyclase [Candidatus Eremiobacteraeota bacterium]
MVGRTGIGLRLPRVQSRYCLWRPLDLDNFKTINDNGANAAGNDTLTVVARIIRPSVREQDVVARLGGDEFV